MFNVYTKLCKYFLVHDKAHNSLNKLLVQLRNYFTQLYTSRYDSYVIFISPSAFHLPPSQLLHMSLSTCHFLHVTFCMHGPHSACYLLYEIILYCEKVCYANS